MTDTELLQALYNDMQTVKHKVTSMEDKVTSLDGRVASLDEKVASLEHEILKINVTLENETNRSIQIIAEGHLDLSRKLNEAIKISSDVKAKQEIQDIYINMHQNQLRAL
ncbi:MAG: hypothetical protein HFH50_00895 [Lachnospiraceae bacterium]|jgi:predicted  nucleic acid-binding Zn-ribbon protein|nr:hypothetical protein [Lachnospiraceae bacterium]MCI8871920.1 hypothetical protein [Lachnospiraceae bacterium]